MVHKTSRIFSCTLYQAAQPDWHVAPVKVTHITDGKCPWGQSNSWSVTAQRTAVLKLRLSMICPVHQDSTSTGFHLALGTGSSFPHEGSKRRTLRESVIHQGTLAETKSILLSSNHKRFIKSIHDINNRKHVRAIFRQLCNVLVVYLESSGLEVIILRGT